MKIIYPLVELWDDLDAPIESHVARCARVCYGKEKGNDKRTYDNLIKRNHLSMLRHATRYFIIPARESNDYIRDLCFVNNTNKICGIDAIYNFKDNVIYIAANEQWCYEHPVITDNIKSYEVNKTLFGENNCAKNLVRYTFKVVTQISTSRELNRVGPNNIAERSTRYVYEDGTICKPHWMSDGEVDYFNHTDYVDVDSNYIVNHQFAWEYINSCIDSFAKYKRLVNYDMRCQDARGVLPLDTATTCIYTYNAKEWSDILDLRYYGKTGAPHPNAKEVANLIRIQLNKIGYEFPD